jgi:hypothetical protein
MILKETFGYVFYYIYTDETLKRLKKFATLLPNNWLAETPQPLAVRGLADSRRKGSGFPKSNWIFFSKKNCRQTRFELICSLGFRVNSEPVSRYFQ